MENGMHGFPNKGRNRDLRLIYGDYLKAGDPFKISNRGGNIAEAKKILGRTHKMATALDILTEVDKPWPSNSYQMRAIRYDDSSILFKEDEISIISIDDDLDLTKATPTTLVWAQTPHANGDMVFVNQTDFIAAGNNGNNSYCYAGRVNADKTITLGGTPLTISTHPHAVNPSICKVVGVDNKILLCFPAVDDDAYLTACFITLNPADLTLSKTTNFVDDGFTYGHIDYGNRRVSCIATTTTDYIVAVMSGKETKRYLIFNHYYSADYNTITVRRRVESGITSTGSAGQLINGDCKLKLIEGNRFVYAVSAVTYITATSEYFYQEYVGIGKLEPTNLSYPVLSLNPRKHLTIRNGQMSTTTIMVGLEVFEDRAIVISSNLSETSTGIRTETTAVILGIKGDELEIEDRITMLPPALAAPNQAMMGVILNRETAVCMDKSYSYVLRDDRRLFAGIAQETGKGIKGKVALKGSGISTVHKNLTPGTIYGIDEDGTIKPNKYKHQIGIPISKTTIPLNII